MTGADGISIEVGKRDGRVPVIPFGDAVKDISREGIVLEEIAGEQIVLGFMAVDTVVVLPERISEELAAGALEVDSA